MNDGALLTSLIIYFTTEGKLLSAAENELFDVGGEVGTYMIAVMECIHCDAFTRHIMILRHPIDFKWDARCCSCAAKTL